jgi:DNA primase
LGPALTPQHVKLLTRFAKRIIYLFDGDRAGLAAADKAAMYIISELGSAGFEHTDFLVALLPEGSDPADYCKAHGTQAMQEVLDNAIPLIRFCIDQRLEAGELKTPEQRSRVLKDALEVLLPLRGTLLANDYLNYLADILQVNFDTVRQALAQMKIPRSPSTQRIPSLETGNDSATPTTFYSHATDPQGATGGSGFDPTRETARTKSLELERELLIFAVGFPAVRKLMAEAFARIVFEDELHASIAHTMCAEEAWLDERPSVLAARIIDAVPEAASMLGAGQAHIEENAALLHARVLMFSLRVEQLVRQIAVLKSERRRLEGRDSEAADSLFIEIADKQKELNEARKRLNELPKMLD